MSFDRTREQLLVLDKNALRADAATAAKARADGSSLGLLVIDTVFKEIVRGGNWPTHYENDFRDWTDRPLRMFVSLGVGELMQEEQRTGTAASIVSVPMTNRQRELLVALARGDRTALVAAGPSVSSELSTMTSTDGVLNANERLAQTRRILDVWWQHGLDANRQVIRQELDDPTDGPLTRLGQIVLMSDGGGRKSLRLALEQSGYTPQVAASLLNAPTFTNFLHSSLIAYSLILWGQGQKLDAANSERFLNQLLDLDYVAYGLCCAGLITNERIIRRLEMGLRAACQSLWP